MCSAIKLELECPRQKEKLDPKSKPAVMIGYAPNAYRLSDKEKKKLFSRKLKEFLVGKNFTGLQSHSTDEV